MITISPLNKDTLALIQEKIDTKTKPLGALGALEPLALQLALITEQRTKVNAELNKLTLSHQPNNSPVSLHNPTMLVFAGDHGINEEGLSIAPSSVTKQMVVNFLQGGAAINCFCQSNDIALSVVDCGILEAVSQDELHLSLNGKVSDVKLVEQRLGAGTNNFSVEAAMSMTQLEQGFSQSKNLIETKVKQGVEIFLLGEMGIANTSAAAALMSALTSFSVEDCVGRGTGISDEQLSNKITLIEKALARTLLTSKKQGELTEAEVLHLLAELGGFEIVQMVSAILSSAALNIPIVIDGFIVSVAALAALRLNKNVADYLIFSHVSQEKAHQVLLDELLAGQTFSAIRGQPLLNLGLRLGEGTGAALAFPLIKAAASFYNNMASFESAGVTV
ncbi:nicotinate-nucleotide--dimethylbenzimidazole phosphoribosyltransferase [Colwellia piezophila]|uniref:nicotinate-nucleotide--dimethylbenzimidazole phosphoribosyltransferase n=1 Tax=Colwellia piezophila TaxID=211668 RepID=UPI000363CF08|nr:nicotinate-nucleotide--dimethylbenzimidazole phosphoribosyltransferase [Colwellia piezophila]